MKHIYKKLADILKGHGLLIKAFGVYAVLCFAVPAYKGKITSAGDLVPLMGKVALSGGLLLLFCFLEYAWKNRKTKFNSGDKK